MNPAPAKRFSTDISQADIDSLLAMLEAPAKPEPDTKPALLSRFRLSSCIDTILVRVELANPAKPQALKSVTCTSWCESLEPDLIRSGAGSRLWLVQIEDPDSERLRAFQDALQAAYGLVSDPEIEWLDIAVDAKRKGIDARRRKDAVARNSIEDYEPIMRAWRDSLIVEGGWRYCGEGTWPDVRAYAGSADSLTNGFFRLYFKREDRGKPLDQCEHRARLERRFARSDLVALGLNRIGDLEGFVFRRCFRRCARWFKFADVRGLFVPLSDFYPVVRQLGLDVRMDARLNNAVAQALARLKF